VPFRLIGLLPHAIEVSICAFFLATVLSETAASQAQDNLTPNENPIIELGETFIPPDVQERLLKLPIENRHKFMKTMVRISGLFKADLRDPTGVQLRLHRWESPVILWADLHEDKTLSSEILSLAAFVRSNQGPELKIADADEGAAFWVLLLPKDAHDYASTVSRVSDFIFDGDDAAARDFLRAFGSTGCLHQIGLITLSGSPIPSAIQRALTVIGANLSEDEKRTCLRKGFSVSLGFFRNNARPGELSWTQDTNALVVPTELDGVMLRLLYSRNLVSGMNWTTAVMQMLRDGIRLYEATR